MVNAFFSNRERSKEDTPWTSIRRKCQQTCTWRWWGKICGRGYSSSCVCVLSFQHNLTSDRAYRTYGIWIMILYLSPCHCICVQNIGKFYIPTNYKYCELIGIFLHSVMFTFLKEHRFKTPWMDALTQNQKFGP